MSIIKFHAVDGMFVELDTSFVSDWSINEPAQNSDHDPVLEIVVSRDHDGDARQRVLVAGGEAYRVALSLLISSAARHDVTAYPTPTGLHFQANGEGRA